MTYKNYILICIYTLLLFIGLRYTVLYRMGSSKEILISTSANSIPAITLVKNLQEGTALEKRGSPTYDYIIANDGFPHFRVFFWIPKNADTIVPYADNGINTNISTHGPVEKWSIVETGKINRNTKLVFIYVPKTFVFLYGTGFEKVIHLRYKTMNSNTKQASS